MGHVILMEMQVPAESRIRVADMLRLVFHFFNIVNLTVGLIVFGVGISLTAAPLPIDGVSKEISVIYGTLLITAVVVILMGFLGIYGCYWVQENGLKFYAVSTILAILLEICLFSMSLVKKDIIIDSLLLPERCDRDPAGKLCGYIRTVHQDQADLHPVSRLHPRAYPDVLSGSGCAGTEDTQGHQGL